MSRFADVTTDTPHGPRPVPEGHIPSDELAAHKARPPKSLRSSLLVWGGLGLALTVGALAARAAASALSNRAEDEPRPRQGPRPRHAPGYAALDDEPRARMRARARADFADYEEHAAELRAAALRARRKRRRPPQKAGLGDIGSTARNIVSLIGTAGTALEAFRQVSAHSDEIMRDFSSAADRLQEFLGARGADKTQKPEADEAPETTRTAEDKRTRSL
jgi:hypothetical protein